MLLRFKYIGIDQDGNKFLIEKYPRKELMNALGYSSASKMYCKNKKGDTFHVGYVIGPHWIDVWGLEGNTFITQV